MALREILKTSDNLETLRRISREVEVFDEILSALLDDLTDTMLKANGVGLAAPQVGILRRAFVISLDGKDFYEFVNPKIIFEKGMQSDEEGCLSIPNQHAYVKRPRKVIIQAYDRHGEGFELTAYDRFAVAVCHEMDHLNGILYTDKIDTELTERMEKKLKNKRKVIEGTEVLTTSSEENAGASNARSNNKNNSSELSSKGEQT